MKKLRRRDLKTLRTTLVTLIEKLPSKIAVFCIIDGISFYEDSVRANNTIKAVQQLVRLARPNAPIKRKKASSSASSSAPFKLLLTCPGRSSYTMEYGIEEREVLDIEGDLVDDDGQGYNDAVWDEDIENELRDVHVEAEKVDWF